MQNYTDLQISHILDIFDKLIVVILNYEYKIWGFAEVKKLENVHLHFCKKNTRGKISEPEFIYL